MKKLIVIISLTFCLLISCGIFKQRKAYNRYLKIPTKEEFDTIPIQTFQLKRIDTVTYKYNNVFYMEKGKLLYKVVSKREEIESCERMVVGNYYDLKIPIDRPNTLNSALITATTMYELEPVSIERSPLIKPSVFITPYIRGVCYIED